jgi:hypothetical protein
VKYLLCPHTHFHLPHTSRHLQVTTGNWVRIGRKQNGWAIIRKPASAWLSQRYVIAYANDVTPADGRQRHRGDNAIEYLFVRSTESDKFDSLLIMIAVRSQRTCPTGSHNGPAEEPQSFDLKPVYLSHGQSTPRRCRPGV